MVWLRNRRGNGVKRTYKRIIDLEKESIVLLINALEAIGDVYGIYGFSGYGRENVEFYVIKDLEERLTDRVKRRIDKVSPLHATRDGAGDPPYDRQVGERGRPDQVPVLDQRR